MKFEKKIIKLDNIVTKESRKNKTEKGLVVYTEHTRCAVDYSCMAAVRVRASHVPYMPALGLDLRGRGLDPRVYSTF